MEKPAVLVVKYGKIHRREQGVHPVGKLRAVCLQKPVFQGDKAGAEVAAVDGREVFRLKRTQCARVVPVAEMPAVFRHLFHGAQHFFYDLKSPAVLVRAQQRCAQRGYERKPHVGRRGAVRDAHRRLLLIVVGRQEIILIGAEKVKIAPYILRAGEQIQPVFAAKLRFFRGRQGEREGGKGSQYPQQSDGLSEYPRREDEKYGSGCGGKPHVAVIACGAALFSFALRGGFPLKQVFAAHKLAPQRRCRRRDAYPGLVRQKPQSEQRLDKGGGQAP